MKTVLNGKAGQLVDVDYHFFDVYDVVKQTNKLQLIHDDHSIDAVAIAPAHPYMLNPLINKLVEHDKKVITFNTDAPQSRRACYIGQNAAVAGRMAAHLAGSLVRGDEKIAIFNSFSVTSGLVERKHSFLEYLKSGDLHADIVGPFEYYDTIESAQEIVMQVLKLNPSIKSIYANNMVGTIGCARAVRESGNQGKMCVVGFDDNAEIRDHMADHIISYTILQEPITQGMDTIMTLLDWLVNDIAPESEMMYIPCSILMKANMDYLPCGVAGRIGKTGHSSSEDSFAAPIVTCS
jgi:LacI family transcriptional regulator